MTTNTMTNEETTMNNETTQAVRDHVECGSMCSCNQPKLTAAQTAVIDGAVLPQISALRYGGGEKGREIRIGDHVTSAPGYGKEPAFPGKAVVVGLNKRTVKVQPCAEMDKPMAEQQNIEPKRLSYVPTEEEAVKQRQENIAWALDRAYRVFEEWGKDGQDKVAAFAQKLAENPLYHFQWAERVIDEAARIAVAADCRRGWDGVSAEKGAQEACRAVHAQATAEALRAARNPPRSTSAMSNLAEQAKGQAWAEMAEKLTWVVKMMDGKEQEYASAPRPAGTPGQSPSEVGESFGGT